MFRRRKKNWGLLIGSQIFISLILLGLLAFLLTPAIKNYRQQKEVDQEINNLKEKIAEAEQQNNEFKKMLDYLESEGFAEEQARLNLGLKKPGEKVVVIQTETEVEATTELDTTVKETSLINSQALELLHNMKKWLEYFFMSQEWESNP